MCFDVGDRIVKTFVRFQCVGYRPQGKAIVSEIDLGKYHSQGCTRSTFSPGLTQQ